MKNSHKHWCKVWGILLICFSLCCCLPSLVSADNVIKIGVINPMTGPAGMWGLSTQCSLERFKVLFNGKWGGITVNGQKYKVDFVYVDDKNTVAGGRAAGEKLIYIDKVDFLVSSLSAEPISGWAPLATKEKKLAVIGGPQLKLRKEWPYLFRVTSNDDERAEALVRLMKEKYGAKSVLYIIMDDLTGKNMKENAIKHEKDRGLEVQDYLMVPPQTTDFYPYLSKALKSNPDYLHCILPLGSVALVVKQARELGYKGKISIPVRRPANLKKWQEIAGVEASMGFVAVASPQEVLSSMGLEQEALIPKMCPQFAGADPVMPMQAHILTMAIEKAQSLDPDKVLKVLRTAEFHSYLKTPVRAGGEKTYGIKNHMTTPICYSTIVGPDKMEFVKEYQIMTP